MAKFMKSASQIPTIKKNTGWGETRWNEAAGMHFSKEKGTPGVRGYIPSFRQYCAELLGRCIDGEFMQGHQLGLIETIRDEWMAGKTDPVLWVKLQAAHKAALEFATPELRMVIDNATGRPIFGEDGQPVLTSAQTKRHNLAATMAKVMGHTIDRLKMIQKDIKAEYKVTCYKECR